MKDEGWAGRPSKWSGVVQSGVLAEFGKKTQHRWWFSSLIENVGRKITTQMMIFLPHWKCGSENKKNATQMMIFLPHWKCGSDNNKIRKIIPLCCFKSQPNGSTNPETITAPSVERHCRIFTSKNFEVALTTSRAKLLHNYSFNQHTIHIPVKSQSDSVFCFIRKMVIPRKSRRSTPGRCICVNECDGNDEK